MPKLKVSLGIGLADCKQYDVIEIDKDEWNDCETEEEREQLIEEYAQEWANNLIAIGVQRIE
jgi:hypothetical protein